MINYINSKEHTLSLIDIQLLTKQVKFCSKMSNVNSIYLYSLKELNDDNFFKKLNNSHPYLIPLKDGTCYDLEKDKVIERLKEHYFTDAFNVKYTEKKPSEKFDKFINEICCHNDNIKKYLQKILAYSLSGHNKGQVFFVFNGTGANGKSLLMSLLKHITGEFNTPVEKDVMISGSKNNVSNALYALITKRIGCFSETEEGETFNEGIIKGITGGEELCCKKLYSDIGKFKFTLYVKLFLLTNKLPQFDGTQDSLLRRIRLFMFLAKFVDNPNPEKKNEYKINYNMMDELLPELDEIFSWIIQGYKHCKLDESFKNDVPAEVKKYQDEYFSEQNSFRCFSEEQITNTSERSKYILRSSLYDRYLEFCNTNDIKKILKKKEVSNLMNDKYNEPVKLEGIYYYKGIQFVENNKNLFLHS
jgi:putative DNA primase/helicase